MAKNGFKWLWTVYERDLEGCGRVYKSFGRVAEEFGRVAEEFGRTLDG